MKLFDLSSEIKIKEWLQQKSEPGYVPPVAPDKTTTGKQYETYLLDEIKKLIKKAGNETGEKRKSTMSKANSLEIQLLASLEQSDYNMMANQMEKVILKYKNEYLLGDQKKERG